MNSLDESGLLLRITAITTIVELLDDWDCKKTITVVYRRAIRTLQYIDTSTIRNLKNKRALCIRVIGSIASTLNVVRTNLRTQEEKVYSDTIPNQLTSIACFPIGSTASKCEQIALGHELIAHLFEFSGDYEFLTNSYTDEHYELTDRSEMWRVADHYRRQQEEQWLTAEWCDLTRARYMLSGNHTQVKRLATKVERLRKQIAELSFPTLNSNNIILLRQATVLVYETAADQMHEKHITSADSSFEAATIYVESAKLCDLLRLQVSPTQLLECDYSHWCNAAARTRAKAITAFESCITLSEPKREQNAQMIAEASLQIRQQSPLTDVIFIRSALASEAKRVERHDKPQARRLYEQAAVLAEKQQDYEAAYLLYEKEASLFDRRSPACYPEIIALCKMAKRCACAARQRYSSDIPVVIHLSNKEREFEDTIRTLERELRPPSST